MSWSSSCSLLPPCSSSGWKSPNGARASPILFDEFLTSALSLTGQHQTLFEISSHDIKIKEIGIKVVIWIPALKSCEGLVQLLLLSF